MAIKTLCAWCGALVTDGELVNGRVSHGMCASCEKKVIAEIDGGVPDATGTP